jgi:hypothetical protein
LLANTSSGSGSLLFLHGFCYLALIERRRDECGACATMRDDFLRFVNTNTTSTTAKPEHGLFTCWGR